MAKPKPKVTPKATSVTLNPTTIKRIRTITGNRSKWIRDLIGKELERLDKLGKTKKAITGGLQCVTTSAPKNKSDHIRNGLHKIKTR